MVIQPQFYAELWKWAIAQTFYAPCVDLFLARPWDSQAVCIHCSLPRCQCNQGKDHEKRAKAMWTMVSDLGQDPKG